MRNKVGPPVSGDDFRFREREVEYAKQALLEGNSLLYFGLRRIGKSSLMKEVKRRIDESGEAYCCLIDVQNLDSASGFFLELMKKLPDEVQAWYSKIITRIKIIPGDVARFVKTNLNKGGAAGVTVEMDKKIIDYWRPLADTIEQAIESANKPVIIMIDELPFFIENIIDAGQDKPLITQILATLRSWRTAEIPMMIAGSISLDQQLKDLRISAKLFNDVTRRPLKPFERNESVELLKELSVIRKLRSWNDETIDYVLDKIDDHFPYFIQVAFSHLAMEDNSDPEYIDRIFRDQIDSDLQDSFFSEFDDRLQNRFTKDEQQVAKGILDATARAEKNEIDRIDVDKILKGRSSDAEVILLKLIAQGLLEQVPGSQKYGFPFRMLHRWRISRGA